MNLRSISLISVSALGLIGIFGIATPAHAVEGGGGFYLLGSRTSNAGIVPPPGVYFQQSIYSYSGSTSAEIARSGKVDIGLDADLVVGMSSVIWAPNMDPMFGGRPYFSGTLVYGNKSLDLGATLTGPGGNEISGSRSAEDTLWGDPILGAGLGWGTGPVFGSLNLLVNVPAGDYEEGRATNLAFNRWAADVTGAVTWMDATGWQTDLAAGITFNGENEDTGYQSGDEFHVEAAVNKTFGSGWTVGLQGYYYNQITGDSGDAAVLGDFKGRVNGIGPAIAWAGVIGRRPVSIEARYFNEFDARNRLEGDALFVNFTMPLGALPGT